jgi:titin
MSETSVRLTWKPDPTSQFQKVVVMQYTDASATWFFYERTVLLPADQTESTLQNLTPGARYAFAITGVNPAGRSGATYQLSMPHPDAPQAPSVVGMVQPGRIMGLAWSPVPGATSYYISQLTSQGTRRLATLTAESTSYQVRQLSYNTPYRFIVEAVNASGATATVTEPVTISYLPPTGASSLQATSITAMSLQLSWLDGQNEAGYRVFQIVGTRRTLLTTLPADSASYAVTGLNIDTAYRFEIEAFNDDGTKLISLSTRTLLPPPTMPGNFTATPLSSMQVRLNWLDATGETSYRVDRLFGSSITSTVLNAGATSFTSSGLLAGQTYQFRVVAQNRAGESASDWITIRTPRPPSGATNVRATAVSSDSVQLTWTDGQAEEGYRIYRQEGLLATLIATIPANASSYLVTGLPIDTFCQFFVEAFNTDGIQRSAFAGARTWPAVAAPTAFRMSTYSQTSVSLSWNDVSNETGYRVYQSQAGVEQLVATLAANTTRLAVTGLTKETNYRFRLVAFNSAGESSSAVVGVTTKAEPPSAIRNFAVASVTANEVQLTWSDSTGTPRYWVYLWGPGSSRPTLVADLPIGTTSYRVTGLAAKSSYQYTVLAYNAGGYVQSNWLNAKTL